MKFKIAALPVLVCGGLFALQTTRALAAETTTLNDGQILGLVKAADEAEVKAAKLAKSRAQSQDVKDFAQHMIDDHTQNKKDDKKAAKTEGVKTEKSDAAVSMKDDAKDKTKMLKKSSGGEFDREYIAMQVEMHQQLLNDLNAKLIPAAQNPDTKAFLENTRNAVQAHLDRAKQIQASLAQQKM